MLLNPGAAEHSADCDHPSFGIDSHCFPLMEFMVSRIAKTLLAIVLAAGAANGRMTDPPPASSNAAANTANSNGPFVELRIAPPEGHQSTAAFRQWVSSEHERLKTLAEQAGTPFEQAELQASIAAHLLAHSLVEVATCRVLSIELNECTIPPNDGTGQAPIAEMEISSNLAKVEASLARAVNALATIDTGPEVKAPEDDEAPEQPGAPSRSPAIEELRQRIEIIGAFARAIRAAMLDSETVPATPGGIAPLDPASPGLGGNSRSDAARVAASGLSPLRENPDPAISAAAGLWQAVLRSNEDDKRAALAILGTATAEPKPGTLPYEFFGKLLRCRLIAERGSPAAALALLLQIEERCDGWFKGDARFQAVRTCAAVRMRILRLWSDRLKPEGNDDDRRWCDEQIAEIASDLSAQSSLLPLSPAIPLDIRLVDSNGGETPTEESEPDNPKED